MHVPLIYGTEKQRWLEAAVAAYAQRQPDVVVELKGMGTVDSVRAIAEGRERPVVWSPADEIALNLLDAEWTLQKGAGLVDRGEDLAPEPLVLSPLVMIAWEERARALAAAAQGDPTDWRLVHTLATNPKGWLGVGGPAEWGYVKPGHTAPNASNSGLQALVLMTYAYHRKRSGLVPADVLDEGYQKWMREIETAVGRFGTSSGTDAGDDPLRALQVRFHLELRERRDLGDGGGAGALGQPLRPLPEADALVEPSLRGSQGGVVSPEQREAARDLRAFLLSPEVQVRALEFGFRPANPEVKVVTDDPANPWNRLKSFGVRVDVPAVAEPPSGEVTCLLLETWRRVVEAQIRR